MTYLRGTPGDRIVDLRKNKGWSQEELAKQVNVSNSTISRIEKGESQKIDSDVILSIAKLFGVSTDFILGLSDDPEPKNFSIGELGLTSEAAKKIYTGEIDPDILNMLLEHPNFGTLLNKIAHFFKGTFAEGFAAQNQLYEMISRNICGEDEISKQVSEDIRNVKTPVYQADLTMIENGFMSIVKDIKKTVDTDFSHSKKLTQETFEGIRQSLVKGGGSLSYRRITAEKMADAVVDQISTFDGITQEMKNNLRYALIPIFVKPQKGKHRCPTKNFAFLHWAVMKTQNASC